MNIKQYLRWKKTALVFVGISLVTLIVPTGCSSSAPAPAPGEINTEVEVNRPEDALRAVENYLLNLARTQDSLRFLALYQVVRWGIHSFVLVEDYDQNYLLIKEYMKDPEGWNVKQYIIQHVFDDAIFDRNTYYGTEVLTQTLSISSCWGYDNPKNEALYTVRWIVDKQTGTVLPENENALRVKAKLME